MRGNLQQGSVVVPIERAVERAVHVSAVISSILITPDIRTDNQCADADAPTAYALAHRSHRATLAQTHLQAHFGTSATHSEPHILANAIGRAHRQALGGAHRQALGEAHGQAHGRAHGRALELISHSGD